MTLMNPVMGKELRLRMRSLPGYGLMTIIAVAFGSFAVCAYWLIAWQVRPVVTSPGLTGTSTTASYTRLASNIASQRGMVLFLALCLCEVLLVALTVPAATSGCVAGERERRTFDLLRITTLRASDIVLGKFFGAVLFVLVTLAVSLPMFSIVLMFGGLSLVVASKAFAVILMTALFFGAIGMAYSALIESTLVASVLAYATVLVLFVGSFIGYWGSSFASSSTVVQALLFLSPLAALLSVGVQGNTQLAMLVAPVYQEPLVKVAPFSWPFWRAWPLWSVNVVISALLVCLLLWISTVAIGGMHVIRSRPGRRQAGVEEAG